MKTYCVEDAKDDQEAAGVCFIVAGWTPDAVREVDSGQEGVRAWMCFECALDAELWDSFI